MIEALQRRIGYRFRDTGLLTLAMTHPSMLNRQNNQRLEFLGDAVLGAVVARLLYDLFSEEKEGELARRLGALVSGHTLTEVARDIALGEALILNASDAQAGGRDNASNLEDALEALIGAMFLDGGLSAVEQFVVPRWKVMASRIEAPPKDAKTALQEWAQGQGLPVPAYRMVDSTGPAHAPEFTIEVSVQGHPPARAKANSKRQAEQQAAGLLLAKVQTV